MKVGYVGFIGLPNAGKSTLLNHLIKQKVSIVSPKPQTTRRRILGIWTEPRGQIIFVDPPGLLDAGKSLNAFLAQECRDVIREVDVLALVLNVDAEKSEELTKIIDIGRDSKKPVFAIITKTEISQGEYRKDKVVELLKQKLGDKVEYISIGGLLPDGKASESNGAEARAELKVAGERIFDLAFKYLPESVNLAYSDVEQATTENIREICAEYIREVCFDELHFEIPYQIAVIIEKFDETNPSLPKIYAQIWVAKESQKAVVIGEKASKVKAISQAARSKIEKLLETQVFLKIDVGVKEDWMNNKVWMKELGYAKRN